MSLLSPRFLALPVIALAVIVALAQSHGGSKSTGTEVAAPSVHRAGNCTTPGKRTSAACAIATTDATVIR